MTATALTETELQLRMGLGAVLLEARILVARMRTKRDKLEHIVIRFTYFYNRCVRATIFVLALVPFVSCPSLAVFAIASLRGLAARQGILYSPGRFTSAFVLRGLVCVALGVRPEGPASHAETLPALRAAGRPRGAAAHDALLNKGGCT